MAWSTLVRCFTLAPITGANAFLTFSIRKLSGFLDQLDLCVCLVLLRWSVTRKSAWMPCGILSLAQCLTDGTTPGLFSTEWRDCGLLRQSILFSDVIDIRMKPSWSRLAFWDSTSSRPPPKWETVCFPIEVIAFDSWVSFLLTCLWFLRCSLTLVEDVGDDDDDIKNMKNWAGMYWLRVFDCSLPVWLSQIEESIIVSPQC